MRNAQSGQRGSALVFALITVMVVATAGAAFLQYTTSVSQNQAATVENRKAFYVAEAGLAESFRGVRLGRTGNLGSAEAPAAFGDGVVWVESVQMPSGQVRMTSTALVGRGRASLSYVVQPTESNLAIFSAEEMVIDDVILVDGYNSEDGSYADHIPTDMALPEPIPASAAALLSQISSEGIPKGCHLGYHNWCVDRYAHDSLYGESAETQPIDPRYLLESPLPDREKLLLDDAGLGDLSQMILGDGGLDDSWGYSAMQPPSFEDRNAGLESDVALWRQSLSDVYDQARLSAQQAGDPIPMRPPVGNHTGRDGLLGSGEGVTFQLEHGEIPEIYGDIRAQVEHALPPAPSEEELPTGPGTPLSGTVSGETHGLASAPELPQVHVPNLPAEVHVVQDDLLPLTIPTGQSGYASLTIEADAEAIIRGPATIVIGQLTLMPGATLTLDTRAGEVAMYVTEGMDLQPGSATVTTSGPSRDLAIQVAAIESDPDGKAPVNLDSFSHFHGTIYAPETEVFVGSDFEVFGRVMARKLTFGPGAKLHVDHAGTQGSSIPEIVSWKVVELPAQVKGLGRNPYEILGVSRASISPLSDSHDLANVVIDIQYTDLSGTEKTYSGVEAGLNWDDVLAVASVERVPNRVTPEGDFAGLGVGSTGTGSSPPEDAAADGVEVSATEEELAEAAGDESDGLLDALGDALGETVEEILPVRDEVSWLVKSAVDKGLNDMTGYLHSRLVAYHAPFSPEEWDLMRQTKPMLKAEHFQYIVDAHTSEGGDPSLVP